MTATATTTKSYHSAVETLTRNPRADFVLVARDATLCNYTRTAVWVEDGELVMAHPTDPHGNPIAAPRDGRYERRYTDDEMDALGEMIDPLRAEVA